MIILPSFIPNDLTFVPTDQSGAAIPLAVLRASATRIGTRYLIDMTITYGVTADGTAAKLGLGALPVAANVAGVGGGFVIYDGLAAFAFGALLQNTNTFTIFGPTGAAITNVQLSAATLRMNFQLPTV